MNDTHANRTRALLIGGALAGPVYVGVGTVEALTRPGFDPTRHSLSLLSNGAWGWVHVAMLIGTGLLTVAGAVGMRRAGAGGPWAPRLIGLYGLGLVGAGLFSADPTLGFPPGTPADARDVSWHGGLHLLCGSIGFTGLVAGALAWARRFASRGERAWAIASAATGVFFGAAFVGIAAGSARSGAVLTTVVLTFTAAVVLAWTWLTAVLAKTLQELQ